MMDGGNYNYGPIITTAALVCIHLGIVPEENPCGAVATANVGTCAGSC